MEQIQGQDQLNLHQEEYIKNKLDQDEIIILSCQLYKFNDYNKKQERFIMITNKMFYALKNKQTIKRKIEIDKIFALTLAGLSNQFVIHVQGENDYRGETQERNKIVIEILKLYVQLQECKLPIYTIDDINLQQYHTTKYDVKKNINKQPTDNEKMYTAEEYKKEFLDTNNQIQNNQNNPKYIQGETIYARERDRNKILKADSFQFIRVLGRGNIGKVVLVQEKQTGEYMAMKQMKKETILQRDQISNTKTEKTILKHMIHPYLCNLIYALQDQHYVYFFMQFMKGGELYHHLAKSKVFSESRTKFYIAQIIIALGFLHSKNIMHRDIKLENILMDSKGNICISDFGLAKILKQNEKIMSQEGTIYYMAPEVIKDEGSDKQSDWWSVGILTYEMLHAQVPFYHLDDEITKEYIITQELQFKKNIKISNECKDFITLLLNKDPEERLGFHQGVNELMQHPWFQDIDWEKLSKKEVEPPFKPYLGEDDWLQYFDNQYQNDNPYPTQISHNQLNSQFSFFNDNSISYQL